MSSRSIIISAIALFLVVNTSYFWLQLPGLWDLGIMLVLGVVYILLVALWLNQLYKGNKERFQNKARNISTVALGLSLALVLFFPFGLYDFGKLEGKDLLIASRTSGGDCNTIIKLKENQRFEEKVVCFGIDRFGGSYTTKGDTILFRFDDVSNEGQKEAYGIMDDEKGILTFYKSKTSTLPLPMKVNLEGPITIQKR